MEELDPKRRGIQHPIPTHPPDPASRGDEDKVVGDNPVPGIGPDGPLDGSPGLGSGHAIDEGVGGAGLGKPPGKGDAATRDRDTRAEDLLDQRDRT